MQTDRSGAGIPVMALRGVLTEEQDERIFIPDEL